MDQLFNIVKDIISFCFRSNLRIEFSSDNIGLWKVGPPYTASTENRCVATVQIHNKGGKPATDCEA